MINNDAIDDLDSIYFIDKINMRSKSINHVTIPLLNFNFVNINNKKDEFDMKNAHENKFLNNYNSNLSNTVNLKIEDLNIKQNIENQSTVSKIKSSVFNNIYNHQNEKNNSMSKSCITDYNTENNSGIRIINTNTNFNKISNK